MQKFLMMFLAAAWCVSAAWSQIDVSGEGSVGYLKSEQGFSQYVVDNGNPTFVWRWDLFADMRISDNVSLMSNFRMLQDEVFHIDYFALRVTDIGSTGVNAQMGLIDLPFGNLGNRRFPKENPFYDLPLMNEHLTSLSRRITNCGSSNRNLP